jgi:hypothetical protein
LWFPRRNIISGGTVIAAYVEPFLSGPVASSVFGTDGETLQYAVQIDFDGHEVPDGEEI